MSCIANLRSTLIAAQQQVKHYKKLLTDLKGTGLEPVPEYLVTKLFESTIGYKFFCKTKAVLHKMAPPQGHRPHLCCNALISHYTIEPKSI